MPARTTFGFILTLVLLALWLLGGCAPAKPLTLGVIPEPPATDRLRVYFKVITSGEPRHGWNRTERETEAKYLPLIVKTLEDSGVCSLAGAGDVDRVLAGQTPPAWDWLKNDKSLVRQVGRAVYADYAILLERHAGSVSAARFLLVNVSSGDTYEAQLLKSTQGPVGNEFRQSVKKTWKSLYRLARKDLLLAALRKGRGEAPPVLSRPPVHLVEAVEEPAVSSAAPAVPNEAPTTPSADDGRPALAVYDLASEPQLRTAAIILSDALREELLRLGKVTLVNRENINQVLQELAIGQLGLADDSQAIDAGKALASSQIVSGQLGTLGGSSILQVKRVEVASHITRFIGSTRCKKGEEEALFDELPALARDISTGL